MKKILSVSLAVLMAALLFVPALAADYTVTFVQPSAAYEGGYTFAKVELLEDGVTSAVKFEEDPNGIYVYYSERYLTLDDIYESYWDQVPPERYSPAAFSETESMASGETLVFAVFTSPVYNAATATVLVNSKKLEPSKDGFYRVTVDRNLTIRVVEDDENGLTGLQKNLFDVKMTSDDGFNVKAPMGQGYKATPYGGDFNFRVKVKKGYSAASMKVGVVRDVPENNFLGEFDSLGNLLNKNEILVSTGVDSEGCRLYTIKNVTSNCSIVVTGVREEKKVDILNMLLKILRQILDFLGIKIGFVDNMTNEYTVRVDNQAASTGVTWTFLGGGDENTDGTLTVMSGNGVTLQVVKQNEDQNVTVSWPGNDDGAYTTNWVGKRDASTGRTIFVANFNVDAISADTVITIR